MSSEKAYLSFYNLVKTALDGAGIAVYYEAPEDNPGYPRLTIQRGPERIENGNLSFLLCQGWITVHKEDNYLLTDTMGRISQIVINATRDLGQIDKFDFPLNPTKKVGFVNCRVSGSIQDGRSTDLNVATRVITWELATNSNG